MPDAAATQVFHTGFEQGLLRLPPEMRQRVEAKIDDIGMRLASYPHYRLSGSNRFRARVGDCRIIYVFDLEKMEIHLLAVGRRSEIYRK